MQSNTRLSGKNTRSNKFHVSEAESDTYIVAAWYELQGCGNYGYTFYVLRLKEWLVETDLQTGDVVRTIPISTSGGEIEAEFVVIANFRRNFYYITDNAVCMPFKSFKNAVYEQAIQVPESTRQVLRQRYPNNQDFNKSVLMHIPEFVQWLDSDIEPYTEHESTISKPDSQELDSFFRVYGATVEDVAQLVALHLKGRV